MSARESPLFCWEKATDSVFCGKEQSEENFENADHLMANRSIEKNEADKETSSSSLIQKKRGYTRDIWILEIFGSDRSNS